MFAGVLAFFLQRPALIGLALLAMACGVQTLRIDHAKHEITAMKAAQKVAEAREAQRTAQGVTISQTAATALVVSRDQIRTVTRTLIEKVPQYVPADADRDCTVPLGWVHLHDAAAQGLSTPAGGPEQAASGVPLSAVAATVVANYGIAYDWKAEALGWRDWYRAQAANWAAK